MTERRMTPLQWRFVEAYKAQPVAEKSGPAAAIEAGYSPSNAAKAAKKLGE